MSRAVLTGLTLLLSCTTYDFAPISPLALSGQTVTATLHGRVSKPELFFLVDRSGSMEEPITPSLPACQTGGGAACGPVTTRCPSSCPTRWSEVQRALGQFATQYPTLGRLGLMLYPDRGAGQCAPAKLTAAGGLAVTLPSGEDNDAALTAKATELQNALLAATPGGGTPTAASLLALNGYSDLGADSTRDAFVILVTDGLPNCNDQNPASGELASSGCVCTLAAGCTGPSARTGCLDVGATVTSVKALRSRNLRTVVLGFGAEFSRPEAVAILNTLSEEGGMARSCTGGASCGPGGSCDAATQLCTRRYYAALDGNELALALVDLQSRILRAPCDIRLDAPLHDPSWVSVLLDGQVLRDSEFRYSDSPQPRIVLGGSACEKVMASDRAHAVDVEVRAVYPVD